MADGGEQRRAQLFGFRRHPGAVHLLGQLQPLDRQRRLVGQGIQQPPLVRRQQGAFLLAESRPMIATTPRAGAHGQEQAPRARQGVGAAPGFLALLEGPSGGGQIALVQRVFRRIAGAHFQFFAFRQQQHHMQPQHVRHLIGGGPEQIVQRGDARPACG